MWEKKELGQIINLQRGYDLPHSARSEGTYPVVSSSGVTDYHAEYKEKGPGVITGRYGTIGEVFYVEGDYWPHNTTLFVEDFKGNYPRFIYYLLQTLGLDNNNDAGAVPGVNRQSLHAIKTYLPPLPLQRQIAAVLGRYDALLENYQQQVAALEGLAQEVYREWFVRGRCPGAAAGSEGELPAGWEVVKLFDVATITYGFPFDSSLFNEDFDGPPVVRIRDIVDSATQTYTPEEVNDKYVLQNGDIIVGMDGEFHINKWTGGRAYLNQRVLRASPKDGIPRYFLLLAIRPPIEFLNSIIVGTTVAHLGDADLRRVEIIRPDADSLDKFGKLADPIYDKVLNLHEQITILRTTRDALLPRLLSGQLAVREAEAALAE